jgi:ABC-type branched-subunit amino acid transport system ATPase component
MQTEQPLLVVQNLVKHYGAIKALTGVSFSIRQGELCGLIGPNGSGKSTLFDCCTGLLRPNSGELLLGGVDVTSWSMNRIARDGRMFRSFQKTVVFQSMTVEENLILAGQMSKFPSMLSTFIDRSKKSARITELRARAREMMELVGLSAMRDVAAHAMSFGQQKLLQFASVLMPQPRIVLLDEPFAGINPVLIERIMAAITHANQHMNVAFVVIEHNLDALSRLCPRIVVLAEGQVIADSAPMDIMRDRRVIDAYLGG